MTNESEAPITITLKAGTGYDAPWLVIRGYDPDDVVTKLTSLDGVIEATLEAAGLFAAGRALGKAQPEAAAPAQQEQPKQQGWGQGGGNAAPAQGQQRKSFGVPHPEGKTCESCSEVLVQKETNNGKKVWRCPAWRWNNGAPNGHSQEWID